MSDDLIVSGGGSIVVASDTLLAQIDALVRLTSELACARSLLAALAPPTLREGRAPVGHEQIQKASGRLALSQGLSTGTIVALRLCLEAYARGEAASAAVAQQLSASMGFGIGWLSPTLLFALPTLSAGIAAAAIGALLTGADPVGAIGTWLGEHSELLNTPAAVALVRSVVMSMDDLFAGALHVPPGFQHAVGDEVLGITGTNTSAAVALLLGAPLGVLVDSAVTVRRTAVTPDSSRVRSLAERAARIPAAGAKPRGEQIRIDRYLQPGRPDRFEVYIAGTANPGITAGPEPWDTTSSVSAIAGLPAGSYRGVVAAMAEAGITRETPVTLTGYSQGGLIASMVAASGEYDVKALVTFAAPIGQVELPADVPQVIHIRHSEDIVPAMGGYDVDHNALVIERAVFADQPIPDDSPFAAHDLDRYGQTASLIDAAESAKVQSALESLVRFGDGTTVVETTSWVARRVPATSGR